MVFFRIDDGPAFDHEFFRKPADEIRNGKVHEIHQLVIAVHVSRVFDIYFQAYASLPSPKLPGVML